MSFAPFPHDFSTYLHMICPSDMLKLFTHCLHACVHAYDCRDVETKGGLDDYLLTTPDRLLRSDVASQLKWRITSIVQRNRLAAAAKTASGSHR